MTEIKRSPRQIDVAKLAGVSKATVSLVLNGRVNEGIHISQETQDRVLNAVRQLGYVVNPAARSLRGGQNRIMGVFIYSSFPIRDRTFYYLFLDGLEEEAAAQDYNLLLFTRAGGLEGGRRIYQNGINHLLITDGAVLLGHEKKEEVARLVNEGYPFVFVGRREIADHDISYVAAGYREAAVRIISHLVELGHRQFAFLSFSKEPLPEATQDRESGYRQAHQRLGLPLQTRFIHYGPVETLTPELLKSYVELGVTAFITDDATPALHITQLARDMGKCIPQDFSLVALGNSIYAEGEMRSITDTQSDVATFVIPRREMGIQAVRLLSHILAHPLEKGPHRLTIPGTFNLGSTIGPPPQDQV